MFVHVCISFILYQAKQTPMWTAPKGGVRSATGTGVGAWDLARANRDRPPPPTDLPPQLTVWHATTLDEWLHRSASAGERQEFEELPVSTVPVMSRYACLLPRFRTFASVLSCFIASSSCGHY